MKKVLLSSLILATSMFAAGGFVDGETTKNVNPVKEAHKAKDDQMVTLQGYIQKKVKDEEYIFVDKNGDTIRVEIDDDKWNGAYVDEKAFIEIYGEVDRDFGDKIEVDVKRVKVLN